MAARLLAALRPSSRPLLLLRGLSSSSRRLRVPLTSSSSMPPMPSPSFAAVPVRHLRSRRPPMDDARPAAAAPRATASSGEGETEDDGGSDDAEGDEDEDGQEDDEDEEGEEDDEDDDDEFDEEGELESGDERDPRWRDEYSRGGGDGGGRALDKAFSEAGTDPTLTPEERAMELLQLVDQDDDSDDERREARIGEDGNAEGVLENREHGYVESVTRNRRKKYDIEDIREARNMHDIVEREEDEDVDFNFPIGSARLRNKLDIQRLGLDEFGDMDGQAPFQPENYFVDQQMFYDRYNAQFVSLLSSDRGFLQDLVVPFVPPSKEQVLKFTVSRQLVPGNQAPLSGMSRVRLDVAVSRLGLSPAALHKLKVICGTRYDADRDTVTITSGVFLTQAENKADVLEQLARLLKESQVDPEVLAPLPLRFAKRRFPRAHIPKGWTKMQRKLLTEMADMERSVASETETKNKSHGNDAVARLQKDAFLEQAEPADASNVPGGTTSSTKVTTTENKAAAPTAAAIRLARLFKRGEKTHEASQRFFDSIGLGEFAVYFTGVTDGVGLKMLREDDLVEMGFERPERQKFLDIVRKL